MEAAPLRSACDSCHRRKLRCVSDGNGSTCANCRKSSKPCVYSPRGEMGRPRLKKAADRTSPKSVSGSKDKGKESPSSRREERKPGKESRSDRPEYRARYEGWPEASGNSQGFFDPSAAQWTTGQDLLTTAEGYSAVMATSGVGSGFGPDLSQQLDSYLTNPQLYMTPTPPYMMDPEPSPHGSMLQGVGAGTPQGSSPIPLPLDYDHASYLHQPNRVGTPDYVYSHPNSRFPTPEHPGPSSHPVVPHTSAPPTSYFEDSADDLADAYSQLSRVHFAVTKLQRQHRAANWVRGGDTGTSDLERVQVEVSSLCDLVGWVASVQPTLTSEQTTPCVRAASSVITAVVQIYEKTIEAMKLEMEDTTSGGHVSTPRSEGSQSLKDLRTHERLQMYSHMTLMEMQVARLAKVFQMEEYDDEILSDLESLGRLIRGAMDVWKSHN